MVINMIGSNRKKMRKGKKSLKLLLSCFAFMLALISIISFPASADYYIANGELGVQKISKTAEVVRFIDDYQEIGDLSTPQDLFIDDKDYVYILDSGNGRVIVYDDNEQLVRVISGKFGKGELEMNKPEGLFVDEIGDIFIADTENGRILHLDEAGNFVEEFFEPVHPTYDNEYPFKPSKIAIDSFGRMFITNSRDYHGIILMDGENAFLGYIASTKIVTTITDKILRLVGSEKQKEQFAREVPPYFSNFLMKDNFIYATSFWSDTGQIRKLTPAGGNVYPEAAYGEINESEQFNFKPAFVDIAVDDSGIIYAAEFVTSKIYVYDMEGNNLAVFGNKGNSRESFETISAIAVNSKGELYVLDRVSNIVRVFKHTELMNEIITATMLFNEGNYEESKHPWSKVLSIDTTNYLANVGLAKTALREGEYKTAMTLYKRSLDTTGYSKGFYNFRLKMFRDYFLPIVLAMIAGVSVLVFLIIKLKRTADDVFESNLDMSEKRRLGITGHARIGLLMIFHPIEGMNTIKRNRKQLSIITPLVLFLALMGVQISYIYTVHFALSEPSKIYSALWQQIGSLFLPLISFLIVGYFLTSLSNGKQTFLEMTSASMYCFLPYILLGLPLSAFSHLLCLNESGLFFGIQAIIWIWCLLLLLISIMHMNEYSLKKLVWTVVKIIFGIICVWMIAALLYVVLYQSYELISGIYKEFVTGSV